MAKVKDLNPLDKDLVDELQKIADEKQVTVISFVAPKGVRTSPVTFKGASIEEDEIYRLEEIVKESTGSPNFSGELHLVIHTPGGQMHTSYKIAHFLRSKFTSIRAFVPYEAASGGTVLCCAADELYLGELGNITPFDPQTRYKGQMVSSYAIVRSVGSMENEYGAKTPEEVPTPWQQMADKFDPVIYDEMNTLLLTSMVYANKLLQKSGYSPEKSLQIARTLGRNIYTHAYQIFSEEAGETGFNIQEDSDTMAVYRKLVSCRLKEEFPRHAIDVFYAKLIEPIEPIEPIEEK